MVNNLFFNPLGNLDLSIIPRDVMDKQEVFFVNSTLFLPDVITFFSKNKRRDHRNWPHISKSSQNKYLI